MNKKLKPSLTFDELLEKLKLRGLIIDTPSKIENINYYFIKGYAIYGGLATKDAKYDYKFIPNLKLSDIYDIYVFDSNLKSIILKMIGFVEKKIKTITANHISNYEIDVYDKVINKTLRKRLGALCYLYPKLYKNEKAYCDSISLITRITQKITKIDAKTDLILKHHLSEYGELFPFWVLINYFSFGDLIKFLGYLSHNAFSHILKQLGINEFNNDELTGYFNLIKNLRNICAHFTRLYCYNIYYCFPRSIKIDNKFHNLFFIVFILKKVCIALNLQSEWNNTITEINHLISPNKNSKINIERMGFHSTWLEDLEIKKPK